MSTVRKYAGLPDLDLAPDIYETPELTDDASTVPTSTTLRTASRASDNSESLEDDADGIDRQRINQDEARKEFLPSNERRQTSTSRISAKRKAHKISERKHRIDNDEIINGVSAPSDEEDESIERRLVRLRREITEVQDQIHQQNTDAKASPEESKDVHKKEADTLTQLLDAIEPIGTPKHHTAMSRFVDRLQETSQGPASKDLSLPNRARDDLSHKAPPSSEAGGISPVAALDARLKSLEDLLGLDSLPTHAQNTLPIKPLLPALDSLDKQFTTLSTSSETSIDKIKDRVRELSKEASTLESNRAQAREALEALQTSSLRSRPTQNVDMPKGQEIPDDSEQVSMINALYGTISTIDSTAPLLPSVLERLRSLRDLHANAANASHGLAEVEKRQEEMKEELKNWREGLERVEQSMQQGQGTLKNNMGVVEGWVKELEGRMESL